MMGTKILELDENASLITSKQAIKAKLLGAGQADRL